MVIKRSAIIVPRHIHASSCFMPNMYRHPIFPPRSTPQSGAPVQTGAERINGQKTTRFFAAGIAPRRIKRAIYRYEIAHGAHARIDISPIERNANLPLYSTD
jgi:hypothetical protein